MTDDKGSPSLVIDEEKIAESSGDDIKGTTSSKELLYSEYFSESDVLDRTLSSTKKPPVIQGVQKSEVLSKIKQFVPVMKQSEAELKLKSPEEYSLEIEPEDENKPAIEFDLALYKDESDAETSDPLDELAPGTSSDAPDSENASLTKLKQILEITRTAVNNFALFEDSDNEEGGDQSAFIENVLRTSKGSGNDSDSTDDDEVLEPQQKRLRSDEAE